VIVHTGAAKPFLDQCVDRECGEMAFVEDDGIAQRDRLLEIGRRIEQVEQRTSPCARAAEPIEGRGPIER